MSWPLVQVRHIARLEYGSSLPATDRTEGDVSVFGSNGPIGHHNFHNTCFPVVVIGRKGSYGKLQYSSSPVFAIDTTYFIDPACTQAHIKWLYYALSTLHLDETGQDVGVPGLSREYAYSQRVPLPPLEGQRAIADYLDVETGGIDALISKKRRMIELLQQRWRSMVKYRMQSLEDVCGTIPLKRLVACLDGRRVPLSAEERSSRSGPYPYYGASGIIDSVDSYLFNETLVLLGEDGAQLADPSCEISFVVQGKVWVNNHAHVLRPVAVEPHFLAMHLTTLDRGTFISGATREKITQSHMNEIPVPNVSMALQSDVARELSLERARCERAVSAISRQLHLLAERRLALITAAVTGELAIPGVAA